jgi:hypothetical protein
LKSCDSPIQVSIMNESRFLIDLSVDQFGIIIKTVLLFSHRQCKFLKQGIKSGEQ